MKATLLLLALLSSTAHAQGPAIQRSVVLSSFDSLELFHAVRGLGMEKEVAGELTIRRARFTAADESVKIYCEQRQIAEAVSTECEVVADGALSQEGQSVVMKGAIGEAIGVSLFADKDVQALEGIFSRDYRRFITVQKVNVPGEGSFPRLSVDCGSNKGLCQFTIF